MKHVCGRLALLLGVLTLVSCFDQVVIPDVEADGRLTVNNDEATLSERLDTLEVQVPIDPASPALFRGVAVAPATAPSAVTLTLIAELDPPTVDGQVVQATSISATWQFSFLISYNTRGDPFAGAVDYVINLIGNSPRLVSSVAFTDSDISAVGLDGTSIYAAQATDASGYATPAAIERLRLSLFQVQLEDNARFDLSSFAATSVLAVGNEIYVTTGDDGHLYALDESDMKTVGQFALDDARWVAHDADNGRIVVAQGTPGRLSVFQEGDFPGGSMTLLNTFPFPGADVPQSKSSVEIVGGKAFIAAGPEGVQVMCLDNGQIVGQCPAPPQPPSTGSVGRRDKRRHRRRGPDVHLER